MYSYLVYGSLGPRESTFQTASGLVLPFLHGSKLWLTDRQTNVRQTDDIMSSSTVAGDVV